MNIGAVDGAMPAKLWREGAGDGHGWVGDALSTT
jgi:hypothetical protein